MAGSPRVHALLDDLFFRAKIEATAAAVGMAVSFAATLGELAARLDADGSPNLVLVDLGLAGEDPAAAIRALKARNPAPTVVAFGAHLDAPALARAREAGADRVLARSALAARLPEILRTGSR